MTVSRPLRAARVGVFSALSGIGSTIPFPSPIGTIAFDSAPGFFAALHFDAVDGALICGIGHAITSIIHGFPLGPLHAAIALGMALTGFAVAVVNTKLGVVPASVVGVAINTALFPLAAPVMGWAGAVTLIPYLLVAASLNASIAAAVHKSIKAVRPIR